MLLWHTHIFGSNALIFVDFDLETIDILCLVNSSINLNKSGIKINFMQNDHNRRIRMKNMHMSHPYWWRHGHQWQNQTEDTSTTEPLGPFGTINPKRFFFFFFAVGVVVVVKSEKWNHRSFYPCSIATAPTLPLCFINLVSLLTLSKHKNTMCVCVCIPGIHPQLFPQHQLIYVCVYK